MEYSYINMFVVSYFQQEKKGSRDIESLLKSHQLVTELSDLLSTTDRTSTNEKINQFIQDIKKTTAAIESINNPEKPKVVYFVIFFN